ncbi:M23 family metallopeptidase [Brevibacterium iodinum]
MIRCDGGVVVLCHLQRRSTRVRIGQHVEIGEEIGLRGNSGNSTEPHVHVQAIDSVDIEHAAAVPITFNGTMPSNGGIVTV